MSVTKEEVLEQFGDGLDCAQVVFRYWAERLGYDKKTACKLSTGFGAGMMQGETCGAVIGAYMAIGLKYGVAEEGPEGDDQKVATVIKDTRFREKFLDKYSSSMCRELLGADFRTSEGQTIIQEKNLMTTFCPQLVADVCDILEEIM